MRSMYRVQSVIFMYYTRRITIMIVMAKMYGVVAVAVGRMTICIFNFRGINGQRRQARSTYLGAAQTHSAYSR